VTVAGIGGRGKLVSGLIQVEMSVPSQTPFRSGKTTRFKTGNFFHTHLQIALKAGMQMTLIIVAMVAMYLYVGGDDPSSHPTNVEMLVDPRIPRPTTIKILKERGRSSHILSAQSL